MTSLVDAAYRAISLIDLTRLEAGDTDDAIASLCRRAGTPYGCVAAVCVYPRFIDAAKKALQAEGLAGQVLIATVVNFPAGEETAESVTDAIGRALDTGADEIDMVFPWRALRDGNAESGRALVTAARRACGDRSLKVILETGELARPELIRQAAEIAIASGSDFLKTSTGKVPVNATPQAARVLLETIHDSERDVGCKVSGGIRTTAQAREYLGLATEIMGADWIGPEHFRFGASGLLDDLLATLGTPGAGETSGSRY